MQLRHWQSMGLCLVGGGFALVGAAVLFVDAMSFALEAPNPATGRIKACYTLLDDLFRTITPLEWARPVELVGALVALVLAFRCAWLLIRVLRYPSESVAR
jgi:hypothetical protein